MKAAAKYQQMLARAAERLASSQVDGGWGLTSTQASSIVNTTEAIFVLSSARKHGLAVDDEVLGRAGDYLTRALPSHYRTRRDGGRGKRIRFLTFGIYGLVLGVHGQVDPTVVDSLEWALQQLEQAELSRGGWPEEAGSEELSLFQTSWALRSLTTLMSLLGPDSDRADVIVRMSNRAAGQILRHRRASGAWPGQPFTQSASPSKTSLCMIGLSAHWESRDDSVVEEVGVDELGRSRAKELTRREVLEEAARWLARNHTWLRFEEADPEVPGTQWMHLAYAIGLEALSRCSFDATGSQFLPAWELVIKGWNPAVGAWNEPTFPPSPTIRASFAAVSALEALLRRHGEDGLGRAFELVSRHRPGAPPNDIELVRTRLGQYGLKISSDRAWWVALDLTERQIALLDALWEEWGPPDYVPTESLAKRLVISPKTVGSVVLRLNRSVAGQCDDVGHLIVSRQRYGYRLDVARVVREN